MSAMTTQPTKPVKLESTEPKTIARPSSLWADTLRYLFRNRSAVIGITIIAIMLLIALLAPILANYDPIMVLTGKPGHTGQLRARAPCIHLLGCPADEPEHYLGIDLNSRDLYSRIIFGTRVSLMVGFTSVTFAIVVGALLGMVSGFLGGWVDNIIMRMMDVLLAFPSLLLAIVIVTVLGPGLQNALLAISIVSIPIYARLARAQVLVVKEYEYITAERSLGANSTRILFFHIFPNSLTPLIVQGTLGIGSAVLEAAALSFIGLGAQPPTPEWGAMLSEGRSYVFTATHLVFFPGFAIMLTVLGFNLLGDGLRDALDPRLNRI